MMLGFFSRKTLRNAISAKFPNIPSESILAAIAKIGKDEKVRSERLSTEDFANLANALAESL